jgi:hypothetical protein
MSGPVLDERRSRRFIVIRSTFLAPRSLVAALSAAALLALVPSVAHAATSTNPCSGQTLTQPFLPWLDPARYTLYPNGGFEKGASSWTLSGGAAVADGNERFQVRAASDHQMLALAGDASATGREMCVSLLDPTVRLFVRNTGSPLSSLEVDLIYTDALGQKRTVPVATLTAGSDWRPTAPILLLANLASPPLVTNGTTQVALRLKTHGADGAWAVDDVYVDPFKTK